MASLHILWSGRNHEWKHTVKPGIKLREYLEKREALYLNPTLEGARKLMVEADPSLDPGDFAENAPLASLHKARCQWLGATDAMLIESVEWLKAHKYETTARGLPPLTPDTRDEQRKAQGLPPLKGLS